MAIKYFVYARKSQTGDERQAESIEDQLKRIREIFPEFTKDAEAVTEKQSAWEPDNRPKFSAMMKEIKKHKGQFGLITRHPDRLARNAIEGGLIVYLLEKGILADLKFTNFEFARNAAGMKALLSAFVDSKYYSDKLSEEVPLIMKERFFEGKEITQPPFGYQIQHQGKYKGKFDKYLEPSPDFPFICEAFKLRLKGKKDAEIKQLAFDQKGYLTKSGKQIGMEKVRQLFGNPVYYGVRKTSFGEVDLRKLNPFFVAAVREEEWHLCQDIKRNISLQSGKQYTHREFALRGGYIRCATCGGAMSAGDSKSRSGKYYSYFRCTGKSCPTKPKEVISADDVFKAIGEDLQHMQFTDQEFKSAKNALIKRLQDSNQQIMDERERITVCQRETQKELNKHIENRMKMGEVDADEEAVYKTRKAALQKQLADYAKALHELDQQQAVTVAQIELFLNLAKNAYFMWNKAKSDEKHDIARLMILNLTVKDKKVLKIQYKSSFGLVAERRRKCNGGSGGT